MKRVIIWGCGIVGKRIYKWIRQYWQKYYYVIGFGDNSESIRLRYREGENLFDDKMICS